MTDHQVLGLAEGFTAEQLKTAYRKKSKQFHPDRNDNHLNSNLAMIRVNQAYANLKRGLKEAPAEIERNTEDRDYKYYREGIARFQKIHPSAWKKVSGGGLFNPHAVETDSGTVQILDEMIETLSRAYHSFSTVVNEFPESCWAGDAEEKLREIEKMTVRYGKIRQSYEKGFQKFP